MIQALLASHYWKRKCYFLTTNYSLLNISKSSLSTPLLQQKDNSGKKCTLLFFLDLYINRDDRDITVHVLDNRSHGRLKIQSLAQSSLFLL